MILYTPLSETDIFPADEKAMAKRAFLSHQGRTCYTEKQDDGSYLVLQLLSTDPNDFLDGSFLPGTIINKP
ncbi:hypothetical protein JNUCC1_03786 [Lentibacillus sp. JNUCC-1]|uniref:YlzJ-like family protein n=1 Tax=Lentibacillus sp. JNUCC-1 TaxID=2654513 RepID=UPI001325D8C0|nr:hypothetical protein [Lentibacillus sp. JNUCC-1]